MNEESLDIRDCIDVMLRRWWLLLAGPVLGVVFAVALGSGVPEASSNIDVPVYQATALVLMDGAGGLGNVPHLVKVQPVLESAVEKTGLPLSVQELRSKVSATPVKDSRLLEISAEDPQQDHAIRIANAVSESLIEYVGTLQQSESRTSFQELPDQPSALVYLGPGARFNSPFQHPVMVAPAEIAELPAGAGVSNALRTIVLAAFVGALISTATVVVVEYLQQRVRSPEQFASHSGLVLLGQVPHWPKKDKKDCQLVVSGNSNSLPGEAIRRVAANLELACARQGIKTLLVVSPNAGDGRTTLLANLGVTLAQMWNEVALVDTDLRSSSLHSFFDIDNQTGLDDLLSDPAMSLAEVIGETSHKRLKVIAGRQVSSNPLELLRCPRMCWCLEQLKETCDFVLLDTPPALAFTDAMALTSVVDGIVLVINSENTRWREVRAMLADLEKTGTPIVGYIWNRAPVRSWTSLARWRREYQKLGWSTPPQTASTNGGEGGGIPQGLKNVVGNLPLVRKS